MEEKVDRSDLVFGRHPVVAALKAGQVNKLWILRGPGGSAINELVQLAREQRVVFQWVDRRRMAALAPGAVHQGVVARTSTCAYQ
ncbi:MAG: 23S rRNA (guanosine(2251)-2'-O)-methyltransferase RlmB, partial [Elusimicrobia bacterium]|nr:23S rRNA (guanosine(2251)-2'-O)-methyltransferase RlmB [Elusimicrobiota bacterium]